MRYYYKDTKGNLFNLKEEREDLISITEEEFNTSLVRPELPDKEKAELKKKNLIEKRIIELKELLSKTDYKAIKYAEGYYTEDEYAPIKAERKSWRDEINKLEKHHIN
jgi:hypothetical protein